jgi:hypothetical protein
MPQIFFCGSDIVATEKLIFNGAGAGLQKNINFSVAQLRSQLR